MNDIVRRAYLISDKKKRYLFFSGIITSFILMCSLILFEYSYVEKVEKTKEIYGKYAFYIDENNEDSIEKIKSQKNVLSDYRTAKIVNTTKEDISYVSLFGSEEQLDLLGAVIVNGVFPKNDNEILIDENYYSVAKQKKEIGDKIVIDLGVNGKKEYEIVGIARVYKAMQSIEKTSLYFAVYEKNPKCNYVFFDLSNYNRVKDDLINIQEKTGLSIYPNMDIFIELGYISKQDVYTQTMKIYNYIFILLVACCIFLYYNFMKLYVNDQFETVAILNLIGVNKKNIVFGMFNKCVSYILSGFLIGFLLAHFCAIFFAIIVHMDISKCMLVFRGTSYSTFLNSIIIISVVLCILITPFIFNIKNLSANALLLGRGLLNRKVKKIHKCIFKNDKCFEYRFAKQQLYANFFASLMTMIGWSIAITVLVVGFFYIKITYESSYDNCNYEYKCSLVDFYSNSSINKHRDDVENNWGFDDKIRVDYLFRNSMEAKLDIKKFSDSYIDYVSEDVVKRMEIETSNDGFFNNNVLIYVVSNKQFEEMLENEGKTPIMPGLKQAIMVNQIRSVSMSNYGFKNSYKTGDNIEVYKNDQRDTEKIEIVDNIKKMNLYCGDENFDIILLVSKDYYNYLFHESIPTSIFIMNNIPYYDKHNYDNLEYMRLSGEYQFENIKEKYDNANQVIRILKMLAIIIFALIVFMVVILIISNIILRINLNYYEYAMMKSLGISSERIIFSFGYENGIIFIKSCIVSMCISYFVTKAVFVGKYIKYGRYLYRYPITIYIIATIMAAFVACCGMIPISANIKKIDSLVVLKKKNY